MKDVVKREEVMVWEAPEPHRRYFGLIFERDVTPTQNLSAGTVLIPPHKEQSKLSRHDAEEMYYVIRGTGKFVLDDREVEVESGTSVYIAPGVGHRAINTSDEDMELLWVNAPAQGVFGPAGGYKSFTDTWKRVK